MRSRYRWVILGVGAAGAGAFSALRMGLPALGPALRDAYGLSLPQVGFAFTAVAVGVMLTLVPWGVLTDRIGERPVMGVGLAGCAAALAATAYAPGYGRLLVGAARRRDARRELDRRERPRRDGLVPARGARLRARHPPDGAAARRRRRRPSRSRRSSTRAA